MPDGEHGSGTGDRWHGGKRLRLDTELYERLREQVLRRDGWRCKCCGARSNLEVHRKEFRSQGREDSEDNLITLCAGCHSLEHRYEQPYRTAGYD